MQASAPAYCGIDFGTSNSTVAVMRGNEIALAPVEGGESVIPSAVFFSFSQGPLFGREAVRHYTDGEPGRLMRSLKSILGQSLFHEKTRLQKQFLALSDVLGLFLGQLKRKAEAATGGECASVVLGRPVQFIEGDEAADRQAQDDLEQAARKLGFRDVSFQFEPIAAAQDYERSVSREELVLIVDIGGGTADFSIVRVGPDRALAADRSGDILANRGIRVGGTDFDRMISMRYAMPHFGSEIVYGEKNLRLPQALFVDLSTWSRINFLYSKETAELMRILRREVGVLPELERLQRVLERHDGHRLIEAVERAKIDLTDHARTTIDLSDFGESLGIDVDRKGVAAAVKPGVERIAETITQTLADAGVKAERIDTVFLTGGSSLMPAVQARVSKLLQRKDLAAGDMFRAVGKGLGIEAQRRYG